MILLIFLTIGVSPTGYHLLTAENALFIATDEGLYRFDPAGPNLNRFTPLQGLPSGRIRFLAYDDGLIWVGADSGVANCDVRLNDWEIIIRGEPYGIEFDEEYVYLATQDGLFRYDKISEDLELISDHRGILIRDKDRLLILDPTGPYYFHLTTEEETRHGLFDWIGGRYPLIGENLIGIIGPDLILRFREEELWQRIELPRINDFITFHDTILFATDTGLFIFDPRTRKLTPFPWSYRGKVNGIAHRMGKVAVATDSGIFELDGGVSRESRQTGMVEEKIRALAYLGTELVAITDNFILFKTESGWQWFKREKRPPRPRLIYWDKTGTYFSPLGQQIRLLGRVSYSYKFQQISGVEYRFQDTTIDLSASTRILNGDLTGFYNNTDPERIDYGIGYKSDHLLKRAFYGKDRFGLPQSRLTPTLRGKGITGEVGGRIAVCGFYGKKMGRRRFEIFTGNMIEKRITIRDSGYQHHRFYTLDTCETEKKVSTIEVYFDDLDPTTNTAETRIGMMIAGRRGDYDRLEPITDYVYQEEFGVIDLKLARIGTVAIRYDGKELLLDSTRMLENRYWLGSGILPFSLELTITDQSGNLYPLSQFGIDQNRDGRIDEEFIDYKSGILRFPRPIINQAISYRLNVVYLSYSPLYQLSHYPIVWGSDLVWLDGRELERGKDYIIDYSTGILLILRTELVRPNSEIEVSYEEEISDSELPDQLGVALRLMPSERLRFSPGLYQSEGTPVFTTPFDLRGRGLSLHLEPISNREDFGGETDLKLKRGGNYLRLKGIYFPEGIEDFGIMLAQKGRWVEKGEIGAGVEIYDLKLSGRFGRGEARDSVRSYHEDERMIRVDLAPDRLPYLIMERGRREGFGRKKDSYLIECGHSIKDITGRFGVGKEFDGSTSTDIYGELMIGGSRIYQRRIRADQYETERIEMSSYLPLWKGITIKTTGYLDDLYDKTGYSRINRFFFLTGELSPWRIPLLAILGHGISISGFGRGEVPIFTRDPELIYLKKEWPITGGFNYTGRFLLSSRVTVTPCYHREYATTARPIFVESAERGEFRLSSRTRLILHHRLKSDLHNQFLDLEHRYGALIITPGLGANLGMTTEVGPRLGMELLKLPLLRIYTRNEAFWAEDYKRSAHSLSIMFNPIKPLLVRTSGSLSLRTDTNPEYLISLRIDGLF